MAVNREALLGRGGAKAGGSNGSVNREALLGRAGNSYSYKPTPALKPPDDIERKVINSFNSLPERERNSTMTRLQQAAQRGETGARRKIELLAQYKTSAPQDEKFGPRTAFGQAVSGIANTFVRGVMSPFEGGSAGETAVRTSKGQVVGVEAGTAASQRDIAIKGIEARLMFGKAPASVLKESATGVKGVVKAGAKAGAYNAGAAAVGATSSDRLKSPSLSGELTEIGKAAGGGFVGGAALGAGAKGIRETARGIAGRIESKSGSTAPKETTPGTPKASVAQYAKSNSTEIEGIKAGKGAKVADEPVTPRPEHQAKIEAAAAKGDFAEVQRIVKAMPDGDPYKRSMDDLFKDRYPKADAKVSNAPPLKTGQAVVDEVKEQLLGRRVGNDVPAPEAVGSKERKFITSVKSSPDLNPKTKELVEGSYDPISNKESIAKADARITANEGEARSFVLNAHKPSAEQTTTAIRLIDKFDQEGRHHEAAEITEHIAKKLTEAGQAVQAASILQRLSPEGIGIFAERQIKRINEKRATALFGRFSKDVKLDADTSANLRAMARNIRTLEGQAKVEAQWELQSALQSLIPTTVGRKVATAQTIAQLLNPKTIIRNIGGNELFYRVERFNKYISTPIDIARSTLTGKDRAITFRTAGQGKYWRNFLVGAKAGWKGVAPDGIETQFDLGGQAFTGKWNPATYLEKSLGATLRGFDYAAYKRGVGNTFGEMATLSAINKGLKGSARKAHVEEYLKDVPKNVLDIADQYGKYITFQDTNLLSKGFVGLKRGLNVGKDFGLGDLVLKYPKTPANLIMRGLDYSPAGFLRSAYLIARPYLSRNPPNTREATLALSRAITGTLGFTGLGYFLADKGVITGRASKDKDVNALQKQTGDGSYRVNLTALRRWATSGFNPDTINKREGDYFASYDWAQPIAMAISIGANANQAVKKEENLRPDKAALASIDDAVQTVADQPLVKGAREFLGGGFNQDAVDPFIRAATGAPASFVPTLLNQVRQVTDRKQREAYTGSPLQQGLAQVANKIPGLSGKLPVKADTLGEGLPSNQGTGAERLFNVFLNPAITQRYKLSEPAKLVVDLYNRTGGTKQVPRAVDKSVTIDGKKRKLSASEYSTMQQFVGAQTNDAFIRLNRDGGFNELSDNDKILVMQEVMTRIGTDAREKMFGKAEKSEEQKRSERAASKERSRILKGISQ